MYITLNSAGEISDSNFKNSFSDSMVIKPESFICCVGAGFETNDTNYHLGYVNEFQFNVGFTYNAVSTAYTFPAGDYTLQGFANTFNNLVFNFSPIYQLELNPQDDEINGVHLQLTVKRDASVFNTAHWVAQNYYQSRHNLMAPLVGQSPTTKPGAEAVFSNNQADKVWAVTGTAGNNYDFLAGARAPITANGVPNYKEPLNMPNRYGFDMNRTPSGQITFSIGDTTQSGSFYLYNAVNYDGADYIDDIDLNALANNYLLRIDFTAAGVASATVRKDDNSLFTAPQRTFCAGDLFKITCEGQNNTLDWKLKVEHELSEDHQVGWIPLDFLAADVPTSLPTDIGLTSHLSYQQDYPCGIDEYKNSCHIRAMGSRLAFLDNLNDTHANAISIEPTFLGANNVAMKDFKTQVPAGTIMPNGSAVFLDRMPDAVTDEWQCIQLKRGGTLGIQSIAPTCFTMCFRMVSDFAGSSYTLWGGDDAVGNPYYMTQVNVAGSNVVEIQSYDGVVNSITPLLNGTGAAMPNWVRNKNYCISVGNGGVGNQIMSVQVTDEDGNYYAANHTTTSPSGRFPDLMYLGADRSPTDGGTSNNRFCGGIWDFRMYQQTTNAGVPTSFTDWRRQHENSAQFSVVTANGALVKNDKWYYNWDDRIDWIETDSDPQLKGFELSPQIRMCPVWQKNDGAAPDQANWVTFGNLNADHNFVADRTATNLLDTRMEAIDVVRNGNFAITCEGTNFSNNALVIGASPSVEMLDFEAGTLFSGAEVIWVDHETMSPNPFVTADYGPVNAGINVREQVYNICIENLPHRTFNGRTRNLCKSILEVLHNETTNTLKGDTELINFIPKHKIWIPLNNAGEMPINELHVRITDGAMIEVEDLVGDTHIHLEIKPRQEIFS